MVPLNSNLREIVRDAKGLMPLAVYDALRVAGSARAPKRAVEIGTAHGASAIAFAMGAVAARSDFHMFTIDRLENEPCRGEPSSRSKFGGIEENRRIIEDKFERAGFSDAISLFIGSSVDFASSGQVPERVDALLIDADGRFDRDLTLFREWIAEGALIVIDDVAGPPKISCSERETRWLDLKHVISAALLEAYVAEGILQEERRVASTAFCTARNVKSWSEARLLEIALQCYRDLVFTKIDSATLRDWAMAEPRHFEEVVLGRRMLSYFGGPIRFARALKHRLSPAQRAKARV